MTAAFEKKETNEYKDYGDNSTADTENFPLMIDI